MIDEHIHTKYSDGEYDEFEILNKIKKANIKEFAICDHDTIEGSKRVFALMKKEKSDLVFHSGVELSCRVFNYKKPVNVHILVRDFDFDDEVLNNFIKQISALRLKKIGRMVKLVKDVYNVKITDEEVNKILEKTNSFGKPHIYQILSSKGNFDRVEFYKNMDKLNSEDLKLSAEEVIERMKNRKCTITLAHPIEVMDEYNLSFEEIEDLIKYLKEKGLDGLEVYHSKQNLIQQAIFREMASKFNLNMSCGSDYHGENVKPDVELGKCFRD